VVTKEVTKTNVAVKTEVRKSWWSRFSAEDSAEKRNFRLDYQARQREVLAQKEEKEARIQSEENYLKNKWAEHCRQNLGVPPELLALERETFLDQFLMNVEQHISTESRPEAESRFRAALIKGTQRARRAVMRVKQLLGIVSAFSLGEIRSHLKSCLIGIEPPPLDPLGDKAAQAAIRLLRTSWDNSDSDRNQSLFSIHRNGEATVFQIGSKAFGFIYLTFPRELLPLSLLKRILSKVLNCTRKFLPAESVVAVYDGEMQDLNPKTLLNKHIIVRSMADDEANFRAKIAKVLEAEAPKSHNTALHLALPDNEESLKAVFPEADPQWDLWKDVARQWKQHANRGGLLGEGDGYAGKDQILASLAVSRNVVIVAAHADKQTLFLPAPPPRGSQIGPEDLHQHQDAIRKNGPMVYLFCCETAQIANLKSFASHLLECGALAVIAPQTKIDAFKSASLFQKIVGGNASNLKALSQLLWAEKTTGYREMEVFIG
jgi:hypothetical protein